MGKGAETEFVAKAEGILSSGMIKIYYLGMDWSGRMEGHIS